MRDSDERKLAISIVIIMTIVLIATTYLLEFREKTGFHGDESGWVSAGFYYADLLLQGDFEWQKWHKKELFSWGHMNPHLGKLILGIPLRLRFVGEEFFRVYNFDRSYEHNERLGNVPPREMLLYARAISAILGVLCCILVFVIGYRFYNLWVGVIAVNILLWNGLFIVHATRAMTDITYNLFLLCVVFCGLLIIHNGSRGTVVLGSLLFGIFSGLATSVKISGIVVGGLFLVIVLFYRFIVHRNRKEVCISLTAFCLSSLVVIYMLNPLFWPDLTKLQEPELGREVASFSQEFQTIVMTREMPEPDRLETSYPQLANLARVGLFPYLFVRWNAYMTSQADRPSASWQGNRLWSFHHRLLVRHATFPWEGLFLLIGLIICSQAMYRALQSQELALVSIPFLYFLCNYVFILVFMKLNWDRYYLPTVLASRIIVAIGIYEVGRYIHRVLGRRSREPQVAAAKTDARSGL